METFIKILRDIFDDNILAIVILTFGWIPLYLIVKIFGKIYRKFTS